MKVIHIIANIVAVSAAEELGSGPLHYTVEDPLPTEPRTVTREVLPVREYVNQQFLKALQGRGWDDWVIGLEKTLAGMVASTQTALLRNDVLQNINRQRELIRRRTEYVPDEEVPSILAPTQKRSKNAWNGRLNKEDGTRLPSFSDLLADTWSDTVKDTVNLPVLGPLNPALWKPEEVADLLGPVLNMIPHETAKLIKHKSDMSELSGEETYNESSWLDVLQSLQDRYDDTEPTTAAPPATGAATSEMTAEIPGFGRLVMGDQWQKYRVNPGLLDMPLLGPLNPSQQVGRLPQLQLPYRAERLAAPEVLKSLNTLMTPLLPVPNQEEALKEHQPLSVIPLLRGSPHQQHRRLSQEEPRSWRTKLTESRLYRAIVHYLPKFNAEAEHDGDCVAADYLAPPSNTRALASTDEIATAELTALALADELEDQLEGKRYYHSSGSPVVRASEVQYIDI